jgi:hypothetical protein
MFGGSIPTSTPTVHSHTQLQKKTTIIKRMH